ncbi:MAG: hypothetical protein S4CHLAM6_13130 [Chlamydiae bacterium]|nr:hypothetical protein [Chlamydiota bacterium]
MISPNLISEQIAASSILPVVMIPACTLLSMIFNNRLISILSFLRKRQDDLLEAKYAHLKHSQIEKSEFEIFCRQKEELWNKHLYYANNKRARLLRWGIVFEYCAIFTFSSAAICILLSYFNHVLSYISGGLLILGTLLVITGLTFGLREILMALSKLGESTKVMEEIADDLLNKFDQK